MGELSRQSHPEVDSAHIDINLSDGRRVFAGTRLGGWWCTVYRGGKCLARADAPTLSQALDAAGAPAGSALIGDVLGQAEEALRDG